MLPQHTTLVFVWHRHVCRCGSPKFPCAPCSWTVGGVWVGSHGCSYVKIEVENRRSKEFSEGSPECTHYWQSFSVICDLLLLSGLDHRVSLTTALVRMWTESVSKWMCAWPYDLTFHCSSHYAVLNIITRNYRRFSVLTSVRAWFGFFWGGCTSSFLLTGRVITSWGWVLKKMQCVSVILLPFTLESKTSDFGKKIVGKAQGPLTICSFLSEHSEIMMNGNMFFQNESRKTKKYSVF